MELRGKTVGSGNTRDDESGAFRPTLKILLGDSDTSFPKAYKEIYDKEKMVLNSLLDQFLILNIYKQHPPYLKAKTKLPLSITYIPNRNVPETYVCQCAQ